eukprot:Opistho-2@17814
MAFLDPHSLEHPTGSMQGFAALLYASASLFITFVNKIVLTSYGFPSFQVVALSQFVATVLVLEILKRLRYIDFPGVSTNVVQKVFPLPLIFFANAISGLGATKKINLPMFSALRRFSIFMTMVAEAWFLKKSSSVGVKVSVTIMIVGAFVAAYEDLTFDLVGYFYVTVNNVFTALNGVVMKKKLDAKDLGTSGLMYYNSLFSIPLLLLYIVAFEPDQLRLAMAYPLWSSTGFLINFGFAAIMGCVLQFSTFLCTKVNSALTTTVVGCLKNILTTYVGMFLGGDYVFSMVNFMGLNLSIFGSLMYSRVTYVESIQSRKANPPPSAAAGVLPTTAQR